MMFRKMMRMSKLCELWKFSCQMCHYRDHTYKILSRSLLMKVELCLHCGCENFHFGLFSSFVAFHCFGANLCLFHVSAWSNLAKNDPVPGVFLGSLWENSTIFGALLLQCDTLL